MEVRSRKKNEDWNTSSKIVMAVAKNQPLIFSEIARHANITTQLLNHHLPKLVNRGVVLSYEDNERVFYHTHPAFIKHEELLESLKPFIEEFYKNLHSIEMSEEKVLEECLLLFFTSFVVEEVTKSGFE